MANTTKNKAKELFDKFGEFDSYEELNEAAEGQLKQGDYDALKELAKENGIDPYDVEDYIDGCIHELTTVFSAALGRLDVQQEKIETIKNPIERSAYILILTFTKDLCSGEDMARAVMRKGKRVKDVFDGMKSSASNHKNGNIGMSCGTDEQLRQIIRAYYLQNASEFKKTIEKLYE
ncbi:MAG: hypothetical protein K6G85_07640 [Eubacterium sp.]|nr:hypothetical protein [Eubacterium sp.]